MPLDISILILVPILALHCQFPKAGSHYLSPGLHSKFSGLRAPILVPTLVHIGHCHQSDLDIKHICLCLSLAEKLLFTCYCPQGASSNSTAWWLRRSFTISPSLPSSMSQTLLPCSFSSHPFPDLFKTKPILSEAFTAVPGIVGSSTLLDYNESCCAIIVRSQLFH